MNEKPAQELHRRTAIKAIAAAGATVTLPYSAAAALLPDSTPLRLGIIADLHGGLAADAESRLDAFLKSMSDSDIDGIIQLGDFAFPNSKHKRFAEKFNAAHENRIHVIGNHEFDFGLKRKDCFRHWGIEAAYYRQDLRDIRFLVLDGNETGSPTHQGGYPSYIGKRQQDWLMEELESTDRPVILLSHQPLAGQSAINNALEIQTLLAKYREKILVCLNGHSHVDSLVQVDGVHYVHINSASYYWVGGDKRMAFYERPLFTTVTVQPADASIHIAGCDSNWKTGDDPQKTQYFESTTAPPETIVVPAIRERSLNSGTSQVHMTPKAETPNPSELKVMTWNIWGRLNQDPRYTLEGKTARQRTIDIVRRSEADLVAMIETYGSAQDIAKSLGFHFHTPAADANLCLFSRYPLTDTEPLTGLSSFSFIAATANLPGGKRVRIYNVWLTSAGRHIVEIKKRDISDEAFCRGDDVRFDLLTKLLKHPTFQRDLKNADEVPLIVAGDFNCVSHLDHTPATRHAKLNHGRILPTKVSKAMLSNGFRDTFREANPDILSSTLGHTWTTVGPGFKYESGQGFVPVDQDVEPEYRDPYARIDYIYATGRQLKTKSSRVIAHHATRSTRSFPEFPSDHAAVCTCLLLD